MEALILTAFVSIVLVLGAIFFFGWNVRQQTHDHSERLALLPLAEESRREASTRCPERKRNGD